MLNPTGADCSSLDITYPAELPVVALREKIADAIDRHQVVIVAGETGSGKTTQLPKICLECGRGQSGMIGHTQPRRLAARNVAARIASELGQETGGVVGYQVRFSERLSDKTSIKLMTDGILLSELQRDRLLRRYDTLIIDEAHERTLNVDFLLGYLRRLLPKRPELKVIITSATIDVEAFAQFFADAPVIEVPGRSYPVEIRYLGGVVADEEGDSERIAATVNNIVDGEFGPRGDVLVFLPGEREIRETAKALRTQNGIEILPLYARLSQAEQARVFAPGRRSGIRIVLATNVAETSLTVPGIRYVIDTGTARISRYSPRSKLQRLPVEPISQASANQRAGRCGRIGPGVCLRLYEESDFDLRPQYTEPEIQRTNLSAVVLQMLALGFGDVERFPFIDPPDSRLVRDGYRVLEELGAVNDRGQLTRLGRKLTGFPVDPRIGRMLAQAVREGCLAQMLIIASALTVQDPRERPPEQQQQADQLHARFRHPKSDFMALLSLWDHVETRRQELSQNQFRKLCRREFLSYTRVREWRDVHRQLTVACRQQQMRVVQHPASPDEATDDSRSIYRGVHRALLSGLLTNIAQLQERREYLGTRNRKLFIFPGSSQARKSPAWIVAAEIVETSRVYARSVAAVDPHWALDINPALLKQHYYSPHWHARNGQVVAQRRTTLFGLTLADRERVHYAPIAPQESRMLMITEGLVPGNYHRPPRFLKHNRRLVREVEASEARLRRRDLVAEDHVLVAFYDERIPADIATSRSLESWLKKTPDAENTLMMQRCDVLAAEPAEDVDELFPDTVDWQETSFRLLYAFEPGGEADGVTVVIPVALLNRAPRFLFDWLVPGLLREKCIALVKSLPKSLRRNLVPAPDYVDRALAGLAACDRDLYTELARAMSSLGNVSISREDWALEKLDDYYRMNIRVVDASGKMLAQGRDLAVLIEQFRHDTAETINAAADNSESPARSNLTSWDFEEIPLKWRFRQAGVDIVTWPALSTDGDTVSIVLFDYPAQAAAQHRLGVLHLARKKLAQPLKQLRKQLLRGNDTQLNLASLALQRATLCEDLIDAALVQVLGLEESLPRRRSEYESALQRARGDFYARACDLEATLLEALGFLAQARQLAGKLTVQAFHASVADVDDQVGRLLQPGFMRDTPSAWLAQYPRYCKAIEQRMERISGQLPKDQQASALVAGLSEPLFVALSSRPLLLAECADAMDYRWMLEELRVSLFAQSLGTRRPVSKKRLQALWEGVEQWLAAHPQ